MSKLEFERYPFLWREKFFIWLYSLVWILLFPFVLLYFLKRSIKEKNYRLNLKERLGYFPEFVHGSIWLHAASLGEFRASVPLIKMFLKRKEKILITTLTPAGREEAKKEFNIEEKAGFIKVVYLPLELSFCYRRFFKRYKPRFGLILEIELWPKMIACSSHAKVPLILAQGQYPIDSFERDSRYLSIRASVIRGFCLIMAKSEMHSKRFQFFGAKKVEIMGELRFEQPILLKHLKPARDFRGLVDSVDVSRKFLCLGSTGPGENEKLVSVIQNLILFCEKNNYPKPFFVYVPRHRKDFDDISKLLKERGLRFLRRSIHFDSELSFKGGLEMSTLDFDGLLGDSLGEINFYYSLSDSVFVGNSFNNLGSHNIIEPLALKKPVVVGPSIWGIEYPAVEALEKGVLTKVETCKELEIYWRKFITSEGVEEKSIYEIEFFHGEHSGAVKKSTDILEDHGFL